MPKGSQKGPQKGPKPMKKRSRKGILKRVSKKHQKWWFSGPHQCGSSLVNNNKIDDFRVLVLGLFRVSFWCRFGSPNGGPKHEKRVPKSHSKTGLKTFVDLKPHINLIDNFHYARNIALPGSISDLYNVQFKISSPSNTELALHNDWLKKYGKNFLREYIFNYEGVNFKEIAEATRDN